MQWSGKIEPTETAASSCTKNKKNRHLFCPWASFLCIFELLLHIWTHGQSLITLYFSVYSLFSSVDTKINQNVFWVLFSKKQIKASYFSFSFSSNINIFNTDYVFFTSFVLKQLVLYRVYYVDEVMRHLGMSWVGVMLSGNITKYLAHIYYSHFYVDTFTRPTS